MTTKPGSGRPLHDRLTDYLAGDDGRKLKRLAAVALLIVLRPLLLRLAALATVASVGVVAGSALTSSAPTAQPAPIKQAWLAKAGPYKIDRVAVPCPGASVNLGAPPKGVGHTTEGGWAGAMGVFRRRYAPHFMVGRDNGRVRIVQFCPLGQISAALKNRAGGVATNHDVRAQVEVVGFSKRTRWQPDPGVLKAYAALLYTLRDAAGIPLRHVGNAGRSSSVWLRASGWYDHAGVPENDHWDMGAFDWSAALAQAAKYAPVLNPGHKPPAPAAAPRYRVCWWQRPMPKATCLEVRYASLRTLAPPPAPKKTPLAGGSVGIAPTAG